MRLIIVPILLVILAACIPAIQKHKMVNIFDPNEVSWFDRYGGNSIKGSALIRQVGGGVVTCAGNEVNLIPSSTYADERMFAIYGSNSAGYSEYGDLLIEDVPDTQYLVKSKETYCDAQGFFKFSNLPDGSYYVVTSIVWHVGSDRQGGALMQAVHLYGGQEVEVVLSP